MQDRSVGLTDILSSHLGFLMVMLIFCAGLGLAQEAVQADSSEPPFQAAETLLKQGKPREALALLAAITEKNPKISGLDAELGKAYFQAREFPQAIAHLKTTLQQDPSDVESMQFLALSFYGVGSYREALPLLEKLGPRLPKDSPDSFYLLSICYVMTQQIDRARNSLAEMFSVPPESAMAYLALAKLLVRQKMVEAAVPQLETALRLDGRILMAHFLLGEIDLYQSKPQAAVAEFQKELAINPTLWLVYWRLGDAYARVGNYDGAEKHLKEAIWLNDGSSAALVLLGEIALKKNDPALAAGFLERGLALDPQNAEAHDKLASAYRALGRDVEANQQVEISKKLRTQFHSNENDVFQTVP
jgi:tetratricopeptide (TPR) repeat protein